MTTKLLINLKATIMEKKIARKWYHLNAEYYRKEEYAREWKREYCTVSSPVKSLEDFMKAFQRMSKGDYGYYNAYITECTLYEGEDRGKTTGRIDLVVAGKCIKKEN